MVIAVSRPNRAAIRHGQSGLLSRLAEIFPQIGRNGQWMGIGLHGGNIDRGWEDGKGAAPALTGFRGIESRLDGALPI